MSVWRLAIFIVLVLFAQILWLPELLPRFVRPDVMFLLVLWLGIRAWPELAMVLAVLIGVVYDMATLNPLVGCNALALLIVAFLPTALEARLLTSNHATVAGLAAGGMLILQGVRYMVYQGAGRIPADMPLLISPTLWSSVIIAALVAVPFMFFVDRWVALRTTPEKGSYAATSAF